MTLSESSGLSSPLSSPPSSLLDVPSSPLSDLSRSPSPPPAFQLFTPPPSQDAGEDMPRPRKRRKIERPDRTTRYLDLTEDTAQSIYDRTDSINTLRHALRNRRKIVVVAGAGISVSAGIPDFRSANGLFAGLQKEHKLKGGSGKQLFDASVYKDATSTSQFHEMVRKLSKMSKRAKPTRFHQMLARLATEGRLLRLYTQNVDGLETQMPPLQSETPLPHKGPWPQTVQLHGGLEKMMCQKCREIMDFDPILFDGAETPTCPKCRETDEIRTNDLGRRSHGIGRLRPRIVLYNESNPDEEAIGAVSAADLRTRPDAIVVVGTSMKIPGVRRIVSEMCKIVRDRREGTTIWINPDSEPTGPLFDNCWDLIVKGGSDEVADLVRLRQWDDPNIDLADHPTEYTDSDVERINARQGEIKINLPPSPLKKSIQNTATAAMTPPRSQDGDSRSEEVSKSKSSETSPIRIKLKVGAKSEEAEQVAKRQQMQVQVNVPPASKTKNPASDGRKLADVLGKENVAKNRKPKTTHKKKIQKAAQGQPQQAKIEAKVTKASAVQVLVPSKKEPLSPRKQSSMNSNRECSDYRSHISGPRRPSFPFMSMGMGPCKALGQGLSEPKQIPTPGMTSSGTTPHDTPDPQTPPGTSYSSAGGSPLMYDRKETVSPKGNVPRDMAKLLN
ncbi:hypothetical protein PMZ80_000626 [Knufia obscura]|uniref:Deacetylase sirtuin-type domain-containing protein n=1 Tax=Knufia obscura TaxID=1635080 RepID=A0ABR0S0T8_9EURO|nr:hypothetical protein PMZ80_000626 [Knufia obscura]